MFTNFEYAGEMLSDYGMMVCSFNGSGGIETVSSGSDITFNQAKVFGSNYFNLYSSAYEAPLSTTFQICKNPQAVKNNDEMTLSVELVSSLQRWLCRKGSYNRFKIAKYGFEHIYWNGTFTCRQISLNGCIIGLELTLLTDAPYAYMDEVSVEYDCPAGTSFDVYDSSDELTDINVQNRPDIEITLLSAGDFILENSLDNKITRIKNCLANEVITIQGKCQIIHSSISSHNVANDFNYYFPRLISTYSDSRNTFTPNLSCKIKLSYSPIRKVGI